MRPKKFLIFKQLLRRIQVSYKVVSYKKCVRGRCALLHVPISIWPSAATRTLDLRFGTNWSSCVMMQNMAGNGIYVMCKIHQEIKEFRRFPLVDSPKMTDFLCGCPFDKQSTKFIVDRFFQNHICAKESWFLKFKLNLTS